MPVLPSSGPISGSQISAAFNITGNNLSIRAAAAAASLSSPDAFSDFYGLGGGGTFFGAGFSSCGATQTTQLYHDGSNSGFPSTGDIVYTNSARTTTASSNLYFSSATSGGQATVSIQVGGRGLAAGEVASISLCP